MSPGNTKTYLDVHVRCPIYEYSFSWIRIFSTDFSWNSPRRHVLRKSIRWKPR